MKHIAFIISDHGFGHASRCTPILAMLLSRGLHITLITSVPRWFFLEYDPHLLDTVDLLPIKTDVGVIQPSSISIDLDATLLSLQAFLDRVPTTLSNITTAFQHRPSPNLVIFDVSILGPLLASHYSIPSIAIANFHWPHIYSDLGDAFTLPIQHMISIYNTTTVWCRYQSSFPHNLTCPSIDIGIIGRSPKHAPQSVRNTLQLPNKKLCLYSFGGHRAVWERLDEWKVPSDWCLVLLVQEERAEVEYQTTGAAKGVLCIPSSSLHPLHISYADIVQAMDLVIGKTGFGLCAELIQARIPFLYTNRPGFNEHPLLVDLLTNYITCEQVSTQDAECATFFQQADRLLVKHKQLIHTKTDPTGMVDTSLNHFYQIIQQHL